MNRTAFLSDVDAAVNLAREYSTTLSGDLEICLLVSKVGVYGFNRYGLGDGGIDIESYNDGCSLYGFRLLFTPEELIPSHCAFNGGIIEPVICCGQYYGFPTVHVGTYVLFNGRLVQITAVEESSFGRSIQIKGIDIWFDSYTPVEPRYRSRFDDFVITVRDIERRNKEREQWAINPDTSAISDYLSSLTIT